MSNNKSQNNLSSIEKEINAIFNLLTVKSPETQVVRKEKVAKEKSCKGIINIFNHVDLRKEAEEAAAYAETKRRGDYSHRKPAAARPEVKYAFYADTYRPDRIGSVAIYGANITPLYSLIRKTGSLFGRRIASISIENGRRPFLDVTFAA